MAFVGLMLSEFRQDTSILGSQPLINNNSVVVCQLFYNEHSDQQLESTTWHASSQLPYGTLDMGLETFPRYHT